MKNNPRLINDNSEHFTDEEFEKLLQDHMNYLTSKSIDLRPENAVLRNFCENKYWVPAQEETAYKGHIFHLESGDWDAKLCANDNVLCMNKADDKVIASVKQLFPKTKRNHSDEAAVTLYIYREGQQEPIFKQVMHVLQDDHMAICSFDLSVFRTRNKIGRFYLLLSGIEPVEEEDCLIVEGNMIYQLDMVTTDAGFARKPPQVRKVDVKYNPHFAKPLWFMLWLSRPFERYDRYSVCCYDKYLTTVCDGKVVKMEGVKWSNRLILTAKTQHLLMEGDYTCILMHNFKPFHKVTFTLGAEGCSVTGTAPLKQGSFEEEMANLISNTNGWTRFSYCGGAVNLKRKVVEHRQQAQIRKELQKFHIDNENDKCNYIIYGQASEETKQLAKLFLGFASDSPVHLVDAESISEPRYAGEVVDPNSEIELTEMVCLYNVGAFVMDEGYALRKLRERMAGGSSKPLTLIGTESEITQLLEKAPYLQMAIPKENRLWLEDFSVAEIVHQIKWKLSGTNLVLSDEAELLFSKILHDMQKQGELGRWNADRVANFIGENIMPNHRKRVMQLTYSNDIERYRQLVTIEACDVNFGSLITGMRNTFEESMAELNQMVGLARLKEDLHTLFDNLRFNNLRRSQGIEVADEGTHHMIFLGNPGTGKTTVAKLMGKMLRATGILSKGEVIVTDRSGIVGRYIGETERNMRMLLSQARGNVLFIDEAYTLTADRTDGKKDFGHRAIECMLTVLAQKNTDMVVILAGYEQEMEQMLDANPGLRGRFPHVFHFADYQADELMQAAEGIVERKHYELTPEARSTLTDCIRETIAQHSRHFSNVRWVEQFLSNHIEPAMARRVLAQESKEITADCHHIERQDVEMAFLHLKEQQARDINIRQRIGFIV